MKTTLDIADSIYFQIKARAALKGTTVRALVLEALKEKLESEAGGGRRAVGWRKVFGKGPKAGLAEVQAVIDEEFSRIHLDDWR
ncbi:MAG: hypothetical protein SGI71_00125 [Verrucomicrobiota bacterium]|nr:hypothetical protein [Verrucomicrobiota bacterium]